MIQQQLIDISLVINSIDPKCKMEHIITNNRKLFWFRGICDNGNFIFIQAVSKKEFNEIAEYVWENITRHINSISSENELFKYGINSYSDLNYHFWPGQICCGCWTHYPFLAGSSNRIKFCWQCYE